MTRRQDWRFGRSYVAPAVGDLGPHRCRRPRCGNEIPEGARVVELFDAATFCDHPDDATRTVCGPCAIELVGRDQ